MNIYKVENPHTGATEFLEHAVHELDSWAVYGRDIEGRVRFVGYSNAYTAEQAAAEVAARDTFGTDHLATAARLSSGGEREAEGKREAIRAHQRTERAKWARVLTEAAVDYARTSTEDEQHHHLAAEHVDDMVAQALHFLGADALTDASRRTITTRVTTAAHRAALRYRDVAHALDGANDDAHIEGLLNKSLAARDALIARLDTIAFGLAAREHGANVGAGCPVKWATGAPCGNCRDKEAAAE